MKLSVGTVSFEDLLESGRLERVLHRSADWGYDAVEPMVCRPDAVDVGTVRAALEAASLAVSGLRTGLVVARDGLSLSDPDPQVRAAAVDRLIAVGRLCRDLGCVPMLNGMAQGALQAPVTYPQARAWIVDGLRTVCAAAPKGVLVCLEPLNRHELSYHNTVAEVSKLLSEVKADNVAVLADTYHMWVEGENVHEGLHSAQPRLGAVHFADSERRAPGLGTIDFAGVVSTLRRIGYEGYVTVELPGREDDPNLGKAARHLRRFIEPAT
jgi:sugar phosphate isomerase/epimerase